MSRVGPLNGIRPLTRRALLLTAALVAVAGCSSSGSDGDTASGPSTTTKPAAVAVAASKGCGGAATGVKPGQEKLTMRSGGVERWYLRHVPPAHDGSRPVPLVVDLHGYAEGAEVQAILSALGPFGDRKGFLTVTPQGTGPVALWRTTPGSPDVTFLRDLLGEVGSTTCVDTNRVFVTGLSNGAMMTSVVACDLADRVAAVAPVAGIYPVKPCRPSRPVPMVAFHGTADPYLAYTGGFGPKVAGLPAADGSGGTLGQTTQTTRPAAPQGPSVPDLVKAWARRNSCRVGAIRHKALAADVTFLSYPCPAGDEVGLYRVQGGGHSWPGSAFSKSIEKFVGPTTSSIDADEIMWAFFRAHPLRRA